MKRLIQSAKRSVRCSLLAGGAVAAVVAVAPAVASAAPVLEVTASHSPETLNLGDERMSYGVSVKNAGDATTSGPVNLVVSLPEGVRFLTGSGTGWTCIYAAQACTTAATATAGNSLATLTLDVSIDKEVAPQTIDALFTAYGGGATNSGFGQDTMTFGSALEFGLINFVAAARDESNVDYTQAGGHPFSANTAFDIPTRTIATNGGLIDGKTTVEDLRDLAVRLPNGFVGNPEVVAGGCFTPQVKAGTCPTKYAVGRVWAKIRGFDQFDARAGVYKLRTTKGRPAQFGFYPVNGAGPVVVVEARVRPGDGGVTAFAPIAPQHPTLYGVAYFTFCSYGVVMVPEALQPRGIGCKSPDDAGAFVRPFLTNPTRCTGEPDVTFADVSSWQNRGRFDQDGFPDLSDSNWKSIGASSPPLDGCGDVPFDPAVTVAPTATAPDSAAGLNFDLDVPQDGLLDPEGIATSHLDKTVVELPDGLTVNPSAGAGLEGCTDDQMGLVTRTAAGQFPVQFDGQPVDCPDGSKLGTAKVTSPLVSEALHGTMYLGQPKSTDPTSGQMLRLFLVVRNDDLGVTVKVEGSTTADPQTGKLVATFDNNPQLPFDRLEVDLKGGDRGVLATPTDCGIATTDTELEPWSGTGAVDRPSSFEVAGDCGEKFAPSLQAGNSDNAGRGQGGTYSFRFSRPDGNQWLGSLTATLPDGLLASVADVPLCSNAAADAGSCPAESRIGVVDAKAGAGDPFVLERKGEMFLTEGYKGGEYGLAVKVRPVAGPFRDEMELSPIVVRQAIHVDRTSARVTAVSDPFPVIHHGIPLRVREVNVLVDRGGFMLNPSDCSAKESRADLVSTESSTANLASPFQVTGCSNLAFKPKLALRLTGRRQVRTGKHPGIRAQVTQRGVSEAGIEKAVVRLPKSLALDVNNAQALCEFADGTKPDLENHCPAGSIVGRARAKTPLLKDDLAGNVYFVKNIRIDPRTGNQIRTLPMIIVALRGEIAINLRGESDTTKAGKLVNTFNGVPDAPVSRFNLNIRGGNNGILAVTRTRRALINLCAKPRGHIAEADMDGHNGRRHDTDIRMRTPCTKRQVSKAKRAAKKAAAAKARAGSRRR